MVKKSGGLNKSKGLDALLSANRASGSVNLQKSSFVKPESLTEIDPNSVTYVKISSVVPNKDQPRKYFNEEKINELADSIAEVGILVPLLVQKKGKYFEIVAGERRWRAAKIAGLKEIPVIVKDYTDKEVAEISLIENIQRSDLNPIEEAAAYKRLLEEYELTQEEVAKRVGKSRTAITNSMRLLKLDERVQKLLIDELLSMGHARAILPIEDGDVQFDTANMIILRKLSVRETETFVKKLGKEEPPKEPKEDTLQLDVIFEELEERLKTTLGTKVAIKRKKAGKGSIEISYFSQEELERLLKMLDSINVKG